MNGRIVPRVLVVLLAVGLVRGIARRRGWAHGPHSGRWEKRVPPMVQEWHRRMHEPQTPQTV